MPRFDYQCLSCNEIFEVTRSFGDKSESTCPKCGSNETKKLITPPAIHFKGEGFYVTDSTKKVEKKEGKAKDAKEKESGKRNEERGKDKQSSTKVLPTNREKGKQKNKTED